MKTFLFAVVAFQFITAGVIAQRTNEQVAAAVEGLRKAMVDGDRAGLEKYTADALSYGHSNGAVETRAMFIESIMSGRSDYLSMSLASQVIAVTGRTAVVRHQLIAGIRSEGKTFPLKLNVLLVWIKKKGKWKLLARQAVKV